MELTAYEGPSALVALAYEECRFLRFVLTNLVATLEGDIADSAVLDRLLPDGYAGDEQASKEFRELTEISLIGGKVRNARACLADLGLDAARLTALAEQAQASGQADNMNALIWSADPGVGATLDLDGDALERWLRTLNDLRLTLGTRIGITQDDPGELDGSGWGSDAEREMRVYYQWLTMLQDAFVQVITGD